MGVSAIETYVCDSCGFRTQRGQSEEMPDWFVLAFLREEHMAGHLLLCPTCVRATGMLGKLQEVHDAHVRVCGGEPAVSTAKMS